jgi:zinc protease
MTLRLITTLLLAMSLMLPAPAAAARAKDELRRQTLPNGLTLILAPDSRAGGVDVSVWYRAGTRWEKAGKTGLTHVVEQLMFRSAPREGQDDYIQRVRRAGGTVGAESTPDYSSFFQTIPPEALELVFEMEADRMTELRLTDARFEEVRDLVRQNRMRAGNTPIVRGMQQLLADAFEGHPYAWPTVGREEDLGALTLDDCLAWHRERYSPGNAVVTVTGRFEPSDAINAAKRTLGKVKRRPVPRDAAPPELEQGKVKRTVGAYSFAGASVLLGWRVPAATSADAAVYELLARYLAGDSSAPLDGALRGPDRPTVYTQCGVESRREAGLFFALAALQPGADSAAVANVEHTILAEVRKVAEAGVQADRFERARKGLDLARLFSSQRPRDRAEALGRGQMVSGDLGAAPAARARLSALSEADLKAAAGRLTSAGAPFTVLMLPAGAAKEEGK